MKISLDLSLKQKLKLTPQLHQVIQLLQLSNFELNQEIENMLTSNPMLERDENASQQSPESAPQLSAQAAKAVRQNNTSNVDIDTLYTSTTDLHEHLTWQVQLSHFNDLETAIATVIIDGIDDDGILQCSLDEVLHDFDDSIASISMQDIEKVLFKIQQLDPPGVGARNLQECLLIQLHQLPQSTPLLHEAEKIIEEQIVLLAKHQFDKIMNLDHLDSDSLKKIVALIQSLNPHPGADIAELENNYIIPDIIIHKEGGDWLLTLNDSLLPTLRINDIYVSQLKQCKNKADKVYLDEHLQQARWFLQGLKNRNNTLLKVATAIFERQHDFFELGEQAMKPMILQDIAREVDMHESTISRITTQKFMHTPRGVFELKYFFSSHVAADNGSDCSSTAIRAMMKNLIKSENKGKPLSDQKLVAALSEKGIHVARRTVTKYREAMGIVASTARKSIG